jgi:hypothetical protein
MRVKGSHILRVALGFALVLSVAMLVLILHSWQRGDQVAWYRYSPAEGTAPSESDLVAVFIARGSVEVKWIHSQGSDPSPAWREGWQWRRPSNDDRVLYFTWRPASGSTASGRFGPEWACYGWSVRPGPAPGQQATIRDLIVQLPVVLFAVAIPLAVVLIAWFRRRLLSRGRGFPVATGEGTAQREEGAVVP